jgi:DNA-binding transcriptional MerR regulator
MAYYAPECVERAQQIKTLQARHRLPLEKIKNILEAKDQGQDVNHLLELNAEIFGEEKGPLMDLEAFCQASGLSPETAQELEQAQLLLPLQQGMYDQEDLAIARIYAMNQALGRTLEEIAFYPRLGKQIVDHEMALRRRVTSHLPEDQDAFHTIEMVKAARALRAYIIDRLFQHRVMAAKDLKDEGMLS